MYIVVTKIAYLNPPIFCQKQACTSSGLQTNDNVLQSYFIVVSSKPSSELMSETARDGVLYIVKYNLWFVYLPLDDWRHADKSE